MYKYVWMHLLLVVLAEAVSAPLGIAQPPLQPRMLLLLLTPHLERVRGVCERERERESQRERERERQRQRETTGDELLAVQAPKQWAI